MNINFLQKKPYCIFEIPNFLSDEQYLFLSENFPNINLNLMHQASIGKKFSFSDKSKLFNSEESFQIKKKLEQIFDDKFFKEIVKKLKREIFFSRKNKFKTFISLVRKYNFSNNKSVKRMFLRKLFVSDFQYSFELSYMLNKSFIVPHTDAVAKLLSFMIYFPTRETEGNKIGTTFYASNFKDYDNKYYNYFDDINKDIFEKNFQKILTLPFKKKSLYCFIKSDNSWHSVEPLDLPENTIRKSININVNI